MICNVFTAFSCILVQKTPLKTLNSKPRKIPKKQCFYPEWKVSYKGASQSVHTYVKEERKGELMVVVPSKSEQVHWIVFARI